MSERSVYPILMRRRKWKFPNDIPYAEAVALKHFYDATGGDSWTNNTNWGKTKVANDWFGITVSGGHVTEIDLNTNNLVGAVRSILNDNLTSLTYLRLSHSSLTTCIVTNLTSLTYLDLSSSNLTDVGVVTGLTGLTELRLYYNSLTDVGNINSITGIQTCYLHNNNFSQATLDTFLEGIDTNRASFTYATPVLNISGATMATPGGVYQYAATPSTGLEYVYRLANDDDSEGFNKWNPITWNGGSAP